MVRLIMAFVFLNASVVLGAEGGNDFPVFSKYLQDKFSQFKNDPSVGYVRYGSPALAAQFPQGNGKFSYNLNQFPAGDSRNYVKGEIEQKVGALAQALAQTAGTALAFDNANQLRQQATQLNASGDPQLQQIASQLGQEATAIEQGNKDQASQIANQIASTPQPIVSAGYTPGPQESAFVQALTQVLGGIAMAAIGTLTGGLANALLAKLGLGGSGMGSILGGGAQNIAAGQSPNNVASNVGTAGVYNAGGNLQNVTTNKINSITAPTGNPSGNTGSLPSAGK